MWMVSRPAVMPERTLGRKDGQHTLDGAGGERVPNDGALCQGAEGVGGVGGGGLEDVDPEGAEGGCGERDNHRGWGLRVQREDCICTIRRVVCFSLLWRSSGWP